MSVYDDMLAELLTIRRLLELMVMPSGPIDPALWEAWANASERSPMAKPPGYRWEWKKNCWRLLEERSPEL